MHPMRRRPTLRFAAVAVWAASVPTAWAQPTAPTLPRMEGQARAPRPHPAGAAGAPATGAQPAVAPAPVAKSAAAVETEPLLRQESRYSFEFSKAEVQDVVKAISDITRQNFIIPERIKGQRITILSPTKITANEAYQVFYTSLAVNGISVVRVGRFYKLVDSKDAIKDTVPTCTEVDGQQQCTTGREQMVTQLLRMRYIDAAQVNTVARSLLSKDGDITVFQPSNALIISEYSPNLRRVRSIIEALDVAGFDDALQIVPIHHASATEIAEKLTQIFDINSMGGRPGAPPPQGRRGAAVSVAQPGQEDGEVQISKIVPDDRTNQLIIKANRRSFDAIKHLIGKIDVPVSEAEHGRVHVYYLENAKAEELSNTLASLTQGGTVKDPKQQRSGPGNLPPGLGNKVAPTSLFEGEVKITADKATNALLVMSSGHDYRALRRLIEKLDVARRQVYVEAAILEVNVKDNEDFSLNYHAPKQFAAGQLGAIPSDGATGFFQSLQSPPSYNTLTAMQDVSSFVSAAGGALGGLFGKAISIPVGVNGQVVSVPSFGLLLRWLTTSSRANVLSTPHVLTTDNEEAHIEVGEKVPFNSGLGGSVGSSLASTLGSAGAATGLGGLGAAAAFSNSVQRIDVSLKLTLTPQINERNKIRLEIDQSVEDIVGQDAQTQTPTTSKRALKTVVVVDNQQTIVLGGLIKNSRTISEAKIPYLGSIPVLGWLFKRHDAKMSKTNLLLVLTPYIISSPEDFQRIFERKMNEQEEFAAEVHGHRSEYRAHLDYSKKTGPFGRLVNTLRREQDKLENGGAGDGSESVVVPNDGPADNGEPHGDGEGPMDGDGKNTVHLPHAAAQVNSAQGSQDNGAAGADAADDAAEPEAGRGDAGETESR